MTTSHNLLTACTAACETSMSL